MAEIKIAITGAGGFLGRHVLERLAASHVELRALCGNAVELDVVRAFTSSILIGDILDTALLDQQFDGSDAVVHLAGPPFVRASFEQPQEYARVHVLGTIAVLEACLRHRVPRLVYLSSAEVYGCPAVKQVSEDQPRAPRSPYGAAKASAEQFVAAMLLGQLTSGVILRPFSIYGPGGPAAALVPTVLRQALHASQVELANLSPIRDYCYVGDVARAVERALAIDHHGAIAINLGSGEGTSVRQLAEMALKVVGRQVPIVETLASDRPRAADIEHLVAENARAGLLLGWQPQVSLLEGLKRTAETIMEPL